MDNYRNKGFRILTVVYVAGVIVLLCIALGVIDLPIADKSIVSLAGIFIASTVLMKDVLLSHVYRVFVPHLYIEHEVSHRPIEGNSMHIGVVAILRNTSKVKVRLQVCAAKCQIFKIASVNNTVSNKADCIRFLLISEGRLFKFPEHKLNESVENEIIINPGQSYREVFYAVIPNDIPSVLIYTNFSYPRFLGGSEHKTGWDGKSFYDIHPTKITRQCCLPIGNFSQDASCDGESIANEEL